MNDIKTIQNVIKDIDVISLQWLIAEFQMQAHLTKTMDGNSLADFWGWLLYTKRINV